ncbi:diguanylate cyclase [Kineococcus glutinatus]|uniref:GGDEF domain-containing protein n=1 Tax=Kineococcus glutinatus TaxID=1070872 RepID=A0ABP9I3K8_9ACTN
MDGPAVVTVFLLAALVCTVAAAVAWRRRANTTAAAALAVLQWSAGAWAACAALLDLPLPSTTARVLLVVNYTAIHLLVAGTLCLSAAVLDPSWRLRRRTALLLAIAPVLVVVATATDGWHHLFFTGFGDRDHHRLDFGPLFPVHSAYCYGLLALALLRLARGWWRAAAVFRHQIGCILAAALVPIALNAVTVTSPGVLGGVDWTPVFFVVTGLVTSYAVFRRGLLQIVPVARAQIVDTLADGVLVVDPTGRIVDVNTAGLAMLHRAHADLPDDVVGLPATTALRNPQVRELLSQDCQRTVEVAPGLHLDLRSRVHRDGRGRPLARVVVARDVSDAVAAEHRLREHLRTIDGLRERLQEEAVRDALTGLHNRRHLVAALEDAVTRATRSGGCVGVVLLDVDHFKLVNDTHGHQAGDEVLCAVAAGLLEGTREGDTVARYGGEEFVVLLPGAGAEAAARRAEEIRARCEAARVPVGGDVRLSVTVSAGVAVFPADGVDARGVLAAADAALYAAKAAGRNRVLVAARRG